MGAGDTPEGGGRAPLRPPPEQRGLAAPGITIWEALAAAGPWPWGSPRLARRAGESPGGVEWRGGSALVGQVWPGRQGSRLRGLG